MSNILLYFGSFNPPHRGHTSILKSAIEESLCDELWVVVSPHNPLKSSGSMADKADRAKMVELALEEEGLLSKVKLSLIEFELPTPSYTVDTLIELKNRFPNHIFSLLIGGDNQCSFEKWKNWSYIAHNHNIYVYPRPGFRCDVQPERLTIIDNVVLMDINSTEIRESLKGVSCEHKWLHDSVSKYIKDRGLWM